MESGNVEEDPIFRMMEQIHGDRLRRMSEKKRNSSKVNDVQENDSVLSTSQTNDGDVIQETVEENICKTNDNMEEGIELSSENLEVEETIAEFESPKKLYDIILPENNYEYGVSSYEECFTDMSEVVEEVIIENIEDSGQMLEISNPLEMVIDKEEICAENEETSLISQDLIEEQTDEVEEIEKEISDSVQNAENTAIQNEEICAENKETISENKISEEQIEETSNTLQNTESTVVENEEICAENEETVSEDKGEEQTKKIRDAEEEISDSLQNTENTMIENEEICAENEEMLISEGKSEEQTKKVAEPEEEISDSLQNTENTMIENEEICAENEETLISEGKSEEQTKKVAEPEEEISDSLQNTENTIIENEEICTKNEEMLISEGKSEEQTKKVAEPEEEISDSLQNTENTMIENEEICAENEETLISEGKSEEQTKKVAEPEEEISDSLQNTENTIIENEEICAKNEEMLISEDISEEQTKMAVEAKEEISESLMNTDTVIESLEMCCVSEETSQESEDIENEVNIEEIMINTDEDNDQIQQEIISDPLQMEIDSSTVTNKEEICAENEEKSQISEDIFTEKNIEKIVHFESESILDSLSVTENNAFVNNEEMCDVSEDTLNEETAEETAKAEENINSMNVENNEEICDASAEKSQISEDKLNEENSEKIATAEEENNSDFVQKNIENNTVIDNEEIGDVFTEKSQISEDILNEESAEKEMINSVQNDTKANNVTEKEENAEHVEEITVNPVQMDLEQNNTLVNEKCATSEENLQMTDDTLTKENTENVKHSKQVEENTLNSVQMDIQENISANKKTDKGKKSAIIEENLQLSEDILNEDIVITNDLNLDEEKLLKSPVPVEINEETNILKDKENILGKEIETSLMSVDEESKKKETSKDKENKVNTDKSTKENSTKDLEKSNSDKFDKTAIDNILQVPKKMNVITVEKDKSDTEKEDSVLDDSVEDKLVIDLPVTPIKNKVSQNIKTSTPIELKLNIESKNDLKVPNDTTIELVSEKNTKNKDNTSKSNNQIKERVPDFTITRIIDSKTSKESNVPNETIIIADDNLDNISDEICFEVVEIGNTIEVKTEQQENPDYTMMENDCEIIMEIDDTVSKENLNTSFEEVTSEISSNKNVQTVLNPSRNIDLKDIISNNLQTIINDAVTNKFKPKSSNDKSAQSTQQKSNSNESSNLTTLLKYTPNAARNIQDVAPLLEDKNSVKIKSVPTGKTASQIPVTVTPRVNVTNTNTSSPLTRSKMRKVEHKPQKRIKKETPIPVKTMVTRNSQKLYPNPATSETNKDNKQTESKPARIFLSKNNTQRSPSPKTYSKLRLSVRRPNSRKTYYGAKRKYTRHNKKPNKNKGKNKTNTNVLTITKTATPKQNPVHKERNKENSVDIPIQILLDSTSNKDGILKTILADRPNPVNKPVKDDSNKEKTVDHSLTILEETINTLTTNPELEITIGKTAVENPEDVQESSETFVKRKSTLKAKYTPDTDEEDPFEESGSNYEPDSSDVDSDASVTLQQDSDYPNLFPIEHYMPLSTTNTDRTSPVLPTKRIIQARVSKPDEDLVTELLFEQNSASEDVSDIVKSTTEVFHNDDSIIVTGQASDERIRQMDWTQIETDQPFIVIKEINEKDKGNKSKRIQIIKTKTQESDISCIYVVNDDTENLNKNQSIMELNRKDYHYLKCNYCAMGFTFLKQIEHHLKHVHNRQIMENNRQHYQVMTTEIIQKCKVDQYINHTVYRGIKISQKLKDLLKEHEKAYLCNLCGHNAFGIRLEKHLVCHTNDKPFVCKFCKFKFRYYKNLSQHYKSVHPNIYRELMISKIKCNYCNTIFSDNALLKMHQNLKHVSKKIPCKYCNNLVYIEEMYRHLRSHETEEDLHICKQCDKVFFSEELYEAHVKLHTFEEENFMDKNTTKFCCDNCNFSCLSKLELEVHIYQRKCSFSCKFCNKSFDGRRNYKKHLRTQKCKQNQQDSRENEANKPKETETKEKITYNCTSCNWKFPRELEYKWHMRKTHNIFEHICQYCKKQFTNNRALNSHLSLCRLKKKYLPDVSDEEISLLDRKRKLLNTTETENTNKKPKIESINSELNKIPVQKEENLDSSLTCKICKITLLNRTGLVSHEKKCKKDEDYKKMRQSKLMQEQEESIQDLENKLEPRVNSSTDDKKRKIDSEESENSSEKESKKPALGLEMLYRRYYKENKIRKIISEKIQSKKPKLTTEPNKSKNIKPNHAHESQTENILAETPNVNENKMQVLEGIPTTSILPNPKVEISEQEKDKSPTKELILPKKTSQINILSNSLIPNKISLGFYAERNETDTKGIALKTENLTNITNEAASTEKNIKTDKVIEHIHKMIKRLEK